MKYFFIGIIIYTSFYEVNFAYADILTIVFKNVVEIYMRNNKYEALRNFVFIIPEPDEILILGSETIVLGRKIDSWRYNYSNCIGYGTSNF